MLLLCATPTTGKAGQKDERDVHLRSTRDERGAFLLAGVDVVHDRVELLLRDLRPVLRLRLPAVTCAHMFASSLSDISPSVFFTIRASSVSDVSPFVCFTHIWNLGVRCYTIRITLPIFVPKERRGGN